VVRVQPGFLDSPTAVVGSSEFVAAAAAAVAVVAVVVGVGVVAAAVVVAVDVVAVAAVGDAVALLLAWGCRVRWLLRFAIGRIGCWQQRGADIVAFDSMVAVVVVAVVVVKGKGLIGEAVATASTRSLFEVEIVVVVAGAVAVVVVVADVVAAEGRASYKGRHAEIQFGLESGIRWG